MGVQNKMEKMIEKKDYSDVNSGEEGILDLLISIKRFFFVIKTANSPLN